MKELHKAASLLPASLANALYRLPETVAVRVQEIRLRQSCPLTLTGPNETWFVTPGGCATQQAEEGLVVSSSLMQETYLRLCEYSVHTHQEELRNGFIRTADGCRVGIAGSAVRQGNEILSVRDITSLCIRVARRHNGCGASLARLAVKNGRLNGMLLCGEPASGKTSLLRDMASQLSDGRVGRFRITVVDERGELSAPSALPFCDVLMQYPKAVGIRQSVRCLAPQGVFFDELGETEEILSVSKAMLAGTAIFSSVHAVNVKDLTSSVPMRRLIASGAFAYIVFLKGRDCPGEVREIVKTEGNLNESDRIDLGCFDGRPVGVGGLYGIAPESENVASGRVADGTLGGWYTIYGGADRQAYA